MTEIICTKCGKAATITAKVGDLCLDCWRKRRKDKKNARNKETLNDCLSYKSKAKVSDKEAKLINEVMLELKASGKL